MIGPVSVLSLVLEQCVLRRGGGTAKACVLFAYTRLSRRVATPFTYSTCIIAIRSIDSYNSLLPTAGEARFISVHAQEKTTIHLIRLSCAA